MKKSKKEEILMRPYLNGKEEKLLVNMKYEHFFKKVPENHRNLMTDSLSKSYSLIDDSDEEPKPFVKKVRYFPRKLSVRR
jgi:hypothetical protein